MQESFYLTIKTNRKDIEVDIRTILYVFMNENVAEIHVTGDVIYKTRMTMEVIEKALGERFLKVHRSCLVSVMAIHDISDKVYLNNGETLNYVVRKKKEINKLLQEKRKNIISSIQENNFAADEYQAQFQCFDKLPIAFADIEMVFDKEQNAVDWIFRYGNAALAKLEKLSLNQIVGNSFCSLFPNMDPKWLRSYERAALYGETLTVIDYSPEIDTYLQVICFPTTQGHCGCILFDIAGMQYAENRGDAQNARLRLIAKMLEQMGL